MLTRAEVCPADLTVVDALNLGDKLQSILYYHFLPQAYNASQLESLGSANTDLGVSTGTPYNLTFGQSPTGQVRVGCIMNHSGIISVSMNNPRGHGQPFA